MKLIIRIVFILLLLSGCSLFLRPVDQKTSSEILELKISSIPASKISKAGYAEGKIWLKDVWMFPLVVKLRNKSDMNIVIWAPSDGFYFNTTPPLCNDSCYKYQQICGRQFKDGDGWWITIDAHEIFIDTLLFYTDKSKFSDSLTIQFDGDIFDEKMRKLNQNEIVNSNTIFRN